MRSRRAVWSWFVTAALIAGTLVAVVAPGPPAQAGPAATGFVSLPPTRVLDSRYGTGLPAAGALAANTTAVLAVEGEAGVPASGVAAVAINLTATATTGPGVVTAYPDGTSLPYASNLNYDAKGQTVADLAIVPVGADGKIALHVSGAATELIGDLEGYYLGGSGAGSFTPLTPTRVLDSRHAIGIPTHTQLAPNRTVDLDLAGTDGVPASGVSAVAVTLTVTDAAATGYIAAYPSGATPVVSNLNFVAGQTVANLAIVRLGADGHLELHVSGGPVQLIVDLAGYVTGPSGADDGSYTPTTPTRILDTRHAIGTSTAGPIAAGHTLAVPIAGQAGMPASGIGAVAVNITVTSTAATGYLQAFAHGAGNPFGSTLNYVTGQTVANLAVVPVAADGSISIYVTAGTEVVLDLAGYFLDPPADTTAPAAVTGLTATATTETATTLSWTNPTDPDLAGLELRRAVGDTAPATITSGSLVASLPASTTGYSDSGLTPGTTYSYAIFARDAVPNWAAPDVVTTTATTLTWTTASIDPNRGEPSSVSCPTATFCMAVDSAGAALRLSGTAWSAPVTIMDAGNDFDGLISVSCTGPSFCIAGGAEGTAYVYRGSTWTASPSLFPGAAMYVSCASTTFCVAVAGRDQRTFDGTSWTAARPFGPSDLTFRAVSCPSTSFCAMIGQTGTTNLAYTWNGRAWSGGSTALTANGYTVWSLSCPSATFCRAATDGGIIVSYNGTKWTAGQTFFTGFGGTSISCTSASWCDLAGTDGYDRTVVAHFNGSSWGTPQPLLPATNPSGQEIGCAATTCVLLDAFGEARRFNGSAWSATTSPDPSQGDLSAVGCRTTTSCVAIDMFGNYLSFNGTSWTSAKPVNPAAPVSSQLACVPSFCLVIDGNGTAWTFNGSVWTARGNTGLDAIFTTRQLSCSSATFCLAISNGLFTVFNGTSWTKPAQYPNGPQDENWSISCTTSDFCVILDVEPSPRLYTYSAGHWHGPAIAATDIGGGALSCSSASSCLLTYGDTSTDTFDGAQLAHAAPTDHYVGSLSCVSTDDCVAGLGDAPVQTWNGSGWDTAQAISGQPDVSANSLACLSATFCVGVGFASAEVAR